MKSQIIIRLICILMLFGGFDMGILNRLSGILGIKKVQADEMKDSKKLTPQENYIGLRDLALSAKVTDFPDIDKAGKHGVYGVLMETGHPEAVVTLATFITGDTSLYFSSGGGMIGGMGHETVRQAAIELNKKADSFIPNCKKTTSFPSPQQGQTVFYILSEEGIFTAKAMDDDLADKKSNLWPLFAVGQDVITEFRIVDERREDKEKGIEYDENSWRGEPGYVNCLLTLMAEGTVKSVILDTAKTLPSLGGFAQGSDHLLSWVKSQKVFYEKLNPLEVCKVILSSAGYEGIKPFQQPVYLEALLIPTTENVSKDGIPTLFKIESIGHGQSLVLHISIVPRDSVNK